jgi:3-oxoacyl-[acyl-carrier protein] reductase
MLEQQGGSIVNIASIEGPLGCEGGSSHNAPKGAVVVLLTRTAMDYARQGIRVDAIVARLTGLEQPDLSSRANRAKLAR